MPDRTLVPVLRGRPVWVWALVALFMSVGSVWLSFAVTPAASVRVGVVDAKIRAMPGAGTLVRSAEGRAVTDATVNHGPLQLQVDVAMRPVTMTEPQLLASLESSRPRLLHAAEFYLLRVAGGALVASLLVTALLVGVGWRLLLPGILSLSLVGGSVGLTVATTRFEAFDAASCSHGWSKYAVANLPALTPTAPTVQPPVEATAAANPGLVGLLLVSDDHLNPEGLRFAEAVQRSTGAAAVLDAGDTASYGVPGEACVLAPLIRRFHVPYVWVRGNHDGPAFTAAMRGFRGVRVLDEKSTVVSGITVFGVADPSFTPRRTTTSSEMEARDADVRVRMASLLAASGSNPDVVLVHEAQMAVGTGGIQGSVPLVLSGHVHRYFASTVQGTLVLHTGTVGAGGLDAFRSGQLRDFGAVLLYFDAVTHRLVKYFVIDGPGGGRAQFTLHQVSNPLPLLKPDRRP